jgi:hypothetical protein
MESKTDNDNAVFWVEVSDNLSVANVTIYIYYGKSDATTTSNIDNTFIFGDDFRLDSAVTSKWTVSGSPYTTSFDSTNGLTLTKASGVATLRSISTFDFSVHKKVISEFKFSSNSNYDAGVYICPTSTTGDPNSESDWVRNIAGSAIYLMKKVSGTGTILKQISADTTVMHKHIVMLKVASTGYVRWILDGTEQYINSTESLYSTTANYLYPYVSAASTYTQSLTIKYIAVAKYVDPEPSHGSWGTEEVPNNPPYAPTLSSPAANYRFNPSASVTFTWTFSDPDAGDSQSAYQLQIGTSSFTTIYLDTGKVSSTAQNTTQTLPSNMTVGVYYWRVKTWDSKGAEGPYSTGRAIIVDRIKITACGILNNVVDTRTGGAVWYTAVYEYDNTPFTSTCGTLCLNSSAMVWATDRWTYAFPYQMSGSQAVFTITGVVESFYGLTGVYNFAGDLVLNWATMEITIGKP